MPNEHDGSERIAAAALAGALAACALYGLELVVRPYAQALAAGETIPYFSRLARSLTGATVVFAVWLLLPRSASAVLLRHTGPVLGAAVGLCVLTAVVWR